jgi:predicted Zn finger-like uncharacterized protein
MSNVRLRRLQSDYDKLRAFLAQQPRIRLIQAQGAPPERYQLELQIKGLREVDEQLQTVANHIIEISLPLSYPRLPPQCRMLTPVFHPNIAPHAICIGDHWSAGEPLWSMVARIGEMIAYQSYNTKSPLNGEAARWVEQNQDRLPLDRTNFVMDDGAPPAEPPDPSIIPLAGEQPTTTLPVAKPIVRPPSSGGGLTNTIGPAAGSPPPSPYARPVSSRPAEQRPPVAKPVPAQQPAATPNAASSSPVASNPPSSNPVAANIVIQCGQCATRYSVPPSAAGRKVRCKKCQAVLAIPGSPGQP